MSAIRFNSQVTEGSTTYQPDRDYEVGTDVSDATAKHLVASGRARAATKEVSSNSGLNVSRETIPPAVGHTIIAEDEHGGRSIFRDPREKGPDTTEYQTEVLAPGQRPIETPLVRSEAVKPIADKFVGVQKVPEGVIGNPSPTSGGAPPGAIAPAKPGDRVDAAGHPLADRSPDAGADGLGHGARAGTGLPSAAAPDANAQATNTNAADKAITNAGRPSSESEPDAKVINEHLDERGPPRQE